MGINNLYAKKYCNTPSLEGYKNGLLFEIKPIFSANEQKKVLHPIVPHAIIKIPTF
jgi:hypothetical protein